MDTTTNQQIARIEPPKEGTATSSFKVVIVSALAPVALLLALIIGLALIDDPAVRSILIDALRYLVMTGIIAGGAIGWKYVDKRGDVSVAKVEALAQSVAGQMEDK